MGIYLLNLFYEEQLYYLDPSFISFHL